MIKHITYRYDPVSEKCVASSRKTMERCLNADHGLQLHSTEKTHPIGTDREGEKGD